MANEPKSPQNGFTIDQNSEELQHVPSVTRLLNRKKLGFSETSSYVKPSRPPGPPARLPEAPVDAPTSISLSETSNDISMIFAPYQPVQTPPPIPGMAPGMMDIDLPENDSTATKIKVVERRSAKRTYESLIEWRRDHLKSGSDPMGKALASLFEKDATSALFLAAQNKGPNNTLQFSSSAAHASVERMRLWTGISWDPSTAGDIWNKFLNEGYLELAPLVIQSQHGKILTRSAFGLEAGEWGIIVRCGTKESCRGLILITSKKSILTEIKLIQSSFTTPLPAKMAA